MFADTADPDYGVMLGAIEKGHRMLERKPRSMLLTHYSRIADVERLAGVLLEQVRALVDMGRAADEVQQALDGITDLPEDVQTELAQQMATMRLPFGSSRPSWISTANPASPAARHGAAGER